MKYQHYKNNKTYILVDKCMIQENNKWVPAVRYREFNGTQCDLFFVRSEREFNEKFKRKDI